MNWNDSIETSLWVNFLRADYVQHRMSVTDKRASVWAAASRRPAFQCQLFTLISLWLSYIFLVTIPYASMQLQMHQQNTWASLLCEHRHTHTNWLLESRQRLLSSGDTEGACCLFCFLLCFVSIGRLCNCRDKRRSKERLESAGCSRPPVFTLLPSINFPFFHPRVQLCAFITCAN